MKLKIIATGSKGNCYLLHGIKEDLLIECGIPFNQIKKALNYDFNRVKYCLLSHEHNDHAKAYEDVANVGISIFTSPKTNKFSQNSTCCKKSLETEEFKITRFDVEHDAVDPQGFLIESKTEFKKLLFITDSYYCKYNFSKQNIDYFMIEVNYQEEILAENEANGSINFKRANRVRESHFELNNVIKFLNASKSENSKAIIPIHMSSENLDCDFAFDLIEKRTRLDVLRGNDFVL